MGITLKHLKEMINMIENKKHSNAHDMLMIKCLNEMRQKIDYFELFKFALWTQNLEIIEYVLGKVKCVDILSQEEIELLATIGSLHQQDISILFKYITDDHKKKTLGDVNNFMINVGGIYYNFLQYLKKDQEALQCYYQYVNKFFYLKKKQAWHARNDIWRQIFERTNKGIVQYKSHWRIIICDFFKDIVYLNEHAFSSGFPKVRKIFYQVYYDRYFRNDLNLQLVKNKENTQDINQSTQSIMKEAMINIIDKSTNSMMKETISRTIDQTAKPTYSAMKKALQGIIEQTANSTNSTSNSIMKEAILNTIDRIANLSDQTINKTHESNINKTCQSDHNKTQSDYNKAQSTNSKICQSVYNKAQFNDSKICQSDYNKLYTKDEVFTLSYSSSEEDFESY